MTLTFLRVNVQLTTGNSATIQRHHRSNYMALSNRERGRVWTGVLDRRHSDARRLARMV